MQEDSDSKMNNIIKSTIIYSRQSSSVIIGLCIGIALSLIQTPFMGDDCTQTLSTQDLVNANLRNLRSDNPGREEDFELRLVVENEDEEGAVSGSVKKLQRPRYYATELGMREKLLVAVISNKESINTFGVAVNKTLSHYVDKLIFFIDGIGTKKLGLNIPIVGFKDEKPLIKVFRVLSYLTENYLHDFDYFFIVSDKTYIHGRSLYRLVQRVSISEHVHMGMLMDHPDSLYCSVDGGIILSHSVLEAVGEQLNWCTRNTYSDSDTDNLGRCILHAVDKPCVSTLQGQEFSSYRLRDDVEIVSHLQLIGGSSLVQQAVTVSNVAEAPDISVLHMYYLEYDARQINRSIQADREEAQAAVPYSSLKRAEDTWPVGSPPPHYPATRFDVIRWETFNATHIFLPSDFENTKEIIGADLTDIMSVVNASIRYMHTKSMGNLEYRKLIYGHRRMDPTRGVDYILSLVFRDNTSGLSVTRKVEASRLLTEPEIIPMPYVTENTRVTLVVPVREGEAAKAIEFVRRYEAECMVKGEHTYLLLALLYSPRGSSVNKEEDVFKSLKDLALKYTQQHLDAGSKVGWVAIHMVGRPPSPFALVDLVVKKLPEDTLILLTSRLAHLTNDFLNRVRMNTIHKWQVFSPIPFTQYHPDVVSDQNTYQKMEVSKSTGHFDKYDFEHISFYVGDYFAVRRLIMESIPIIKFEKELIRDHPEEYEFGIYGLFVRASSVHVLRSPEPSLKLEYQSVGCKDRFSDQSQNERQSYLCTLQEGQSFGLRAQLSKLILDYVESKEKKL